MSKSSFSHGHCVTCNTHASLQPVHGERCGPLCCLLCIGKWEAEHMLKRGGRRCVTKALQAYSKAGGHLFGKDFDDLKFAVSSSIFDRSADFADPPPSF